MTEKNELSLRIGGKLKALRNSLGLSMKQLSQGTGLSTALFSRIENGLIIPSIPTLEKISDYLKVDIGYFFEKGNDNGYVISKPGNRRIELQRDRQNKKIVYQSELLADGMDNVFMEPTVVTITGRDDEVEASSHIGQEFSFVLEGQLHLTLGTKKITLHPGECVYFNSVIPHKGTVSSEAPAKVLNVHLVPGRRTGSHGVEVSKKDL